MLEELTLKAGKELAKRIRLKGRPVDIFRGEFDVENKYIMAIVRIGESTRRYMVNLHEEDIDNILSSNTPIEVYGVDYLGHLLFGSEEAERRYFRALQEALMEERIGQPEYGAIRAGIRSRLNSAYRELFGDDLMNNKRRFYNDILASAGAGLLGILNPFKHDRKGIIVPFLYSVFGFAIAELIQRYMSKKEIIERYRIKPDDPFLGKFLGKTTKAVQETQKVY